MAQEDVYPMRVRFPSVTLIQYNLKDKILKKKKFQKELLTLVAKIDSHDQFYWSTNSSELKYFFNCSDLFAWAHADMEPIETKEDLKLLKQCITTLNLLSIDSARSFSTDLYCCRKRNRSPQEAYFKYVAKSKYADQIEKLFRNPSPTKTTHINLNIDLYLPENWGLTKEEVVENIKLHYDDLGHLIAEQYSPNDTSYAKVYSNDSVAPEQEDKYTLMKDGV